MSTNNRRLNRLYFGKTILIPMTGDALDEYRKEYNTMLFVESARNKRHNT